MNCARYRFLIQQRFDVEIAPQDDHSLLIHLESCDSCQKFHHQVQQVILASEELPIPEELLPQKLETLARSVIEQLPQPKPGIFAGLLAMFKKDGAQSKAAQNGGGGKLQQPAANKQSAFPHRRAAAALPAPQTNTGEIPPPGQRYTEEDAQQAQAMSGKMRNMSKFAPPEAMGGMGDSREAQSSTRSLGEKFGVQAPNADSLMNDQSLTLAEAIRRKVSESPKQDSSGSQAPISGSGADQWGQAAAPFKPVSAEGGSWGAQGGFGGPPPQPSLPGNDPSEWKLFSNSGVAAPAPAGTAPGAPSENKRVESWASNDDAWDKSGGQPGGPAGAPAAKIMGSAPPVPGPAVVPPVAAKDPWGDVGSGAGKGAASADPWGDVGTKSGGNDAWAQPVAKSPVPPIAAPDNNSWNPQPKASPAPAAGSADPWAQPMGTPNQDPWGQPASGPGSDPWGQPASGSTPDPWQVPNAPAPQAQAPAPKIEPVPAAPFPTPPQTPPGGDWGPAPKHGTWDAPADFKDNWQRKSEPDSPVPPKQVMKIDDPPPAQPPGWNTPASAGSFGNFASQVESAAPSAPPAKDPWSNSSQFAQSQAPQQAADPWNHNAASFGATPGVDPAPASGGWGTPGTFDAPNPTPEPAKPVADTWNNSGPKPAAAEAAPGGDPWGSSSSFGGATSWGEPQATAPQNPPDSWNNSSNSSAAGSAWPAPAAAQSPQPNVPNAPAQPAPNPFANASPPAQPSNAWETPGAPADMDNGWNAPQPTTASGTNPVVGWSKPAALQSGIGNSPWSAGGDDKKSAVPPVSKAQTKLPAYSLEAEQVETGTWKAFRPDETLGAKAPATPAPNPAMNIPPPAPTEPVPVPGASTEDWELPIQEKLKRQKARAEGAITSNQLEAPANEGGLAGSVFAALNQVLPSPAPQQIQPPVQPQPIPQPMQQPMPQQAMPQQAMPQQPMQPAAQVPPPQPTTPPQNAGVSSWANLNNPMGEQTLKHNIPDADLWGIPNETPAVGAGAQNSFDPSKNPYGTGANAPTAPGAIPAAHPAPAAAGIGQGGPGLSAGPAVTASSWDLQVIQASEQLGYDAPAQGGMPFGSAIINQASVGAAPATVSQPKISPVPTKNTFPGYTEFNANPPAQAQPAPAPFAQAPQAVPQPAPSPAPTPAPSSEDRGLFQLDDSAMDKLFSENLGVQERSVKPATPAPAPVQPAPAPAPTVQPVVPQQPAQPAPAAAWPGSAPATPQEAWGAPPQASAPVQPAPKAPDPWQSSSSTAPAPGVQPWTQPAQPTAPAPAPVQPAAPQPWSNSAPSAPAPSQPAPQWPQSAPQPAAAPWQQAAQPAPASAPAAPAPSQYAAPTNESNTPSRLFSIDDSVIDRIFADNLGVKDEGPAQAAPPSFPPGGGAPQAQAPAPAPLPVPPKASLIEAVKQITDVAVSSPIPPPKIEGLGRLDARPDSTTESGSGRISSIGKFLLDGKDLEKIGKITSSDLSDTTMRILTMEAASELQSLLQHIGSQHGVLGSVIVGHDGLLIANTMPPEIEGESLGIWALAVYMNTQNAARSLGNDRVYQIVSKTPRGYLIIADFGSGLLVTVTETTDSASLVSLMRNITQLVAA